jgi:hypothetical protein
LPFAPFCLPRFRPLPFARLGAGFDRPGKSSLEGGIDEFELLRLTCRSNRRTRYSNAAFTSRSSPFSPVCSRTSAINSSRGSSSNPGQIKIITESSPRSRTDTPETRDGADDP